MMNIGIYNGMHYITKQLSVSFASRWRCPVSNCRKSVGLHDRTFFDKLKVSLRQWVVLMYWWIRQYPVSDVAQEAEV